jgi:hypothetical protein
MRARTLPVRFVQNEGDLRMQAVQVFFYGLFMDEKLLRSKELDPHDLEQAWVQGWSLRIGQRATVVSDPPRRVYGRVMSLTMGELDRLYIDPTVREYRPVPVLAQLERGEVIPALCYVLPIPPDSNEHNAEYAGKLRALARSIGLPNEYIESIE